MKLYKLRPDKVETWKQWGKQLMSEYRDAALATLEKEHVYAEAFYVFELNGETYTIGDMCIEPGKVFVRQNDELTQQHREIRKECTAEVIELAEVYTLTRNPDDVN